MSDNPQIDSASDKLSMVISGEALKALRDIARRENKALDEVVESALGLKEWSLDVRDAGDEIVVRHRGGDKYALAL